ncbi:MAG: diaminopimelate epimerase [Clostridiales bacterium]|nr:diaminopimelate epimerase [Clostridiales bacterium]MCF8022728.1 diaminopimelate epimerase [Clostridiales bacterium]
MHFKKVQGLGNDFVLIDAGNEKLPGELAPLAQKICNRNFGIGADGLVLIKHSNIADIRMQIINSDGSEAEMCGNAIRCVGKYVYENGIVNKKKINVETGAGIIVPEVIVNDKDEVYAVKVKMGEPKLDRENIPMNGPPGKVVDEKLKVDDHEFNITCVSMGNPHGVIFVPVVEEISLDQQGPGIENHEVFPAKINAEFVQVLSRSEIQVRVWERGAGPTLACGTGACASAVAANLCGYTNRKVSVHLPGGSLDINWSENDNNVYMTGPAVEVFSGEYFLK